MSGSHEATTTDPPAPATDFFGFFGALKRGDFFCVHPKKSHFGSQSEIVSADILAVAVPDELSVNPFGNTSAAVDMFRRQGSNLALVGSWLVGLCAVVAVTRVCSFTGSIGGQGNLSATIGLFDRNRRKTSMRKICGWSLVVCSILTVAMFVAANVPQAQARPQYLKWWLKEFPDVAKKNNLKASSCNVCHVGAKKANRNDYGKALTKALAPKKNVKDKDTFDDAVKAAAKEKGPDADKTFGELLEAGDLPSK
jgi:hypothetical protein